MHICSREVSCLASINNRLTGARQAIRLSHLDLDHSGLE